MLRPPEYDRKTRATTEMDKFMQRPIAVLAIVVVVAVALYGLVASVLPRALVVPSFVSSVEEASGLRMHVAGEATFTVFPRPVVTIRGVTLQGPALDAPIRLGDITARLRLWPLLTGDLVFDDIVLSGARLELSVLPPRSALLRRLLENVAGGAPAAFSLRGGEVSLSLAEGVREAFTKVDATLARSGSRGLTLDGAADWRGQRLKIRLGMGDLPVMLDGKLAGARLTLASRSLYVAMNGRAGFGGRVNFDGAIELATNEPRRLAEAIGWDAGGLPEAMGLKVRGTGQITPGHMTMGQTQFQIGDSSAQGALALHWTAPRVVAQATLAFDRLAIDTSAVPWLARGTNHPVVLPGFLDNPIDLDLRVSAADLVVGGTAMQRLAGSLITRADTVSLDIGEVSLLGGQFGGRLRLARKAAGLSVAVDAMMRSVPLAGLVATLPALSGLTGTVGGEASAKATCAMLSSCLSAMTGAGSLTVDALSVPAPLTAKAFVPVAHEGGQAPAFGSLTVPKARLAGAIEGGRLHIETVSLGTLKSVRVAEAVVDFVTGTYRLVGAVESLPPPAPADAAPAPIPDKPAPDEGVPDQALLDGSVPDGAAAAEAVPPANAAKAGETRTEAADDPDVTAATSAGSAPAEPARPAARPSWIFDLTGALPSLWVPWRAPVDG